MKLLTWLLFITQILFCYNSIGQISIYERMYGTDGNDNIVSILPSDNRNYYLIGNAELDQNVGGYDVYIIKCDSIGDTLWTRIYGAADWDFVRGANLTNDGGVVVSGETDITGNNQYNSFLLKVDENGELLWSKSNGGSNGEESGSVITTDNGDLVQVGGTGSSGSGLFDFHVIRRNSEGVIQWAYTYGTSSSENGIDILETSNGDLLVLGEVSDKMALLRLSSSGSIIWNKSYGGSNNFTPLKIIETSDGNFLATGDYDEGSWDDIFAIKVNNEGDTIWTRVFGGATRNDYGGSVIEMSPNKYLFTGRISGLPGKGYVISTDENGDTLWTSNFIEGFTAAAVINNNEFLLGGTMWGGGGWGGLDNYLVKPNFIGKTGCNDNAVVVETINHSISINSNTYSQLSATFIDNNLNFTRKSVVSQQSVLCSETDTSSLSTNTNVNYQSPPAEVILYPNPASIDIIIEGPPLMEIYDIVYGAKFPVLYLEKNKIDISRLPNGVYILNFGSAKKKLIVHH